MPCTRISRCVLVYGFVLTNAAHGGGFASPSQGAPAMGYALAATAVTEDASTVWWNPAGMSRLGEGLHTSFAVHALKPSFKFHNTGSTGVFAAPGTGDGEDGGGVHPALQQFASKSISSRMFLGIGVSSPFGLSTEYDNGWRGQSTALKSESVSINLNPALAYRVAEHLTVGVGLNFQWFKAKLTNFAGPALGTATLKADDTGWGWNVGILFHPSDSLQVGAAYRSRIAYTLEGDARFSANPGAASGARADFTVPDTATIGFASKVGDRLTLMADIAWTGWSSVSVLTPLRTEANALGAAGSPIATLPFNWRDTVRLSVGLRYDLDPATSLRFGVARDPTPTKDEFRTPRLPDQDRTFVSLGLRHRFTGGLVLDAGWMHQFIKSASVSVSVPPAPGALVGSFDSHADILSVQLSKSF